MSSPSFGHDEFSTEDPQDQDKSESKFKKLKRPVHASKRSKTPERLRGMHRRRRRRMGW